MLPALQPRYRIVRCTLLRGRGLGGSGEHWRSTDNSLLAADAAFKGVRWRQTRLVPITIVDALIDRFCLPSSTKIDVEAAMLRGLNQPLPALSIRRYVMVSLEPALGAFKRLQSLGRYDFNRSEGESLRIIHAQWLDFGVMAREKLEPRFRCGVGRHLCAAPGPGMSFRSR